MTEQPYLSKRKDVVTLSFLLH